MKIILFILLISTLIYSKSIEFTQKDNEKIKNNPNKTAIHIENSLI